MPLTRRALASIATIGLVELLWARDGFAAAVRPAIGAWLKELAEMSRALRERRLDDREFQALLDDLYGRVDVRDLHALVDLDAVMARMELPASGAATTGVDLGALVGGAGLGRRIFGCRQGRAIVPHGHADMCSGFIVLAGRWRGRHYDRLATLADHYLIRPTIDRAFAPGEHSTVSDHRDNVHWFEALSERAFLFNIHVATRPGGGGPRRLYLDPDGERLGDGTIRAARLDEAACRARYGGG